MRAAGDLAQASPRGGPGRLQEHDLVASAQQQRGGGDDDGGQPLPLGAQPPGHKGLRVGVQGARRLDEDEHGGAAGDGPGQGHALALPAGEVAGLLRQLPLQPAEGVHDVPGDGDPEGAGGVGLPLGGQGSGGASGVGPQRPGVQGHEVLQVARRGERHRLAEDLARQRPGEGLGAGPGDDDGAPHLRDGHAAQVGAPQRDGDAVVGPSEALGQGGRRAGPGAHQAGHGPAAQPHPGGGVHEVAARVQAGVRVDGAVVDQGRGGGDAGDLLGAHPGAGHELHEVGQGAHGPDEEGGVAVEGDELARAQPPAQGRRGGGPHDDGGEDHGRPGADGGQQRLGGGDLDAGVAHAGGGLGVAGRVDGLPADAAQDPQAGDDVGGHGGQPALLLALVGHAAVEGLDQGGDEDQDDRNAQQDEQAQPDVHAHHERADDESDDEGGDDVGDEVHEVADGVGVGGDGGHDVAAGHGAGDGAGALAQAVGGAADAGLPAAGPGAHGEHLGEGADDGAQQAEPGQGRQARQQAGGQAVGEGGVHHRAQDGGDEADDEVAQEVQDRGRGERQPGVTQEGAHPGAGIGEDPREGGVRDGEEARPAPGPAGQAHRGGRARGAGGVCGGGRIRRAGGADRVRGTGRTGCPVGVGGVRGVVRAHSGGGGHGVFSSRSCRRGASEGSAGRRGQDDAACAGGRGGRRAPDAPGPGQLSTSFTAMASA